MEHTRPQFWPRSLPLSLPQFRPARALLPERAGVTEGWRWDLYVLKAALRLIAREAAP